MYTNLKVSPMVLGGSKDSILVKDQFAECLASIVLSRTTSSFIYSLHSFKNKSLRGAGHLGGPVG